MKGNWGFGEGRGGQIKEFTPDRDPNQKVVPRHPHICECDSIHSQYATRTTSPRTHADANTSLS